MHTPVVIIIDTNNDDTETTSAWGVSCIDYTIPQ
jgi:hypothetical protein